MIKNKKSLKIALSIFALIVISVAIFGLQKGIWDENRFYKLSTLNDVTRYSSRDKHEVTIYSFQDPKNIHLYPGYGQPIKFTYEISENGSYKNIRLFNADNVEALSLTYNSMTKKLMNEEASNMMISNYIYENFDMRFPLTDGAISNMLLNNNQIRVFGNLKLLLLALLAFLLGYIFCFLKDIIFNLDKFFMSFTYDNTEKLNPSDLSKALTTIIGIIFFSSGIFFLRMLLFA